jgi:hypothetical protein
MEGWVKHHRKIFENGVWKIIPEYRLFEWLFSHAVFNRKGEHFGNVTVNRGQYLRSYRKLKADLEYIENNQVKQYALSTIKRAINSLKVKGMIIPEETELGTLFTICNYDKYQSFSNTDNTQLGTVTKQQRNNNKNDKEGKIRLQNLPNGAV